MNTHDARPSLGRRFGARLIDGVIVLPLVAVGEVLVLVVGGTVGSVIGVLLLVAAFAVAIFNQVIRVGLRGRSFGRQALGLRVVDQDNQQPIGIGRAFVRELVFGALFAACSIPGIVNVFITAKDGRGQGWHDKAARSLTVPADRPAVPGSPAGVPPAPVAAPGMLPPTPPTPPTPQGAAAAPPPPPYTPARPPAPAPGSTDRPTPARPAPAPAPEVPNSQTMPPGQSVPRSGPPAMIGPPPGMTPAPPEPDDTLIAPRAEPRPGWRLTTPSGQTKELTAPLVVGRDPDAALAGGAETWVLEDPELTVSKTHALLGLADGVAWVEDWNSTNGVALRRGVAELVLEPRARTPLRDGDVIEFGTYKVTVEGGS